MAISRRAETAISSIPVLIRGIFSLRITKIGTPRTLTEAPGVGTPSAVVVGLVDSVVVAFADNDVYLT